MGKIIHKITDVARAVAGKKDRIQPTSAVIVASGNSTRMGGVSKQMMMLDNIPVIVRTIKAFDECEYINEIIVVAKAEEFYLYQEFQKVYKFKKLTRLVSGGATRQESVKNGFEAISKDSKFVAIHDGARCLITAAQIEKICAAAYKCGGATAATRAVDSVKVSSGKNLFIESSANRNHVWLAQTPQIFRTDIYELALIKARDEGLEVTDDNSLVENLGARIKLVECGRNNLKITTPEDVPTALAIIKSREEAK
ncbi:MAG: 2-C-methyl-D-erythritol 4-phosphate cytidylyltransferase [Clostridia bacterium]|nr:2-C-methyl-D-erythritol 4-phosphate cytidylyltransferase [Clostridia bacterium]